MAYKIIKQNKNSTELGDYCTYGIQIGEILVEDISLNRENLENLVSLMNKENLSPIHLMDVIEDFLAE